MDRALLVVATLLLGGAAAAQAEPPRVHIRGTVVVAGSGAPLRAVVRLQSLSGPLQIIREAGADGRFDFAVPPDRYNVEVSAGGYEEDERELTVDHDVDSRVALRPRGRYESTVTLPLDVPHDGASSVILTHEQIRSIPGGVDRELPEVLRVEAGVTPDALGQNHVRGNYSDIRYWLDGVPLPPMLSNQLLTLIPTQVVSKIELTVGGMPIEFAGISGVARVATAIPDRPWSAWLDVNYGSDDTTRPAAAVTARLGKLSLLAAGRYEYTARGLDSPTATPIVHDHMQSGEAFAKATLAVSAQDTVDLSFAFRQSSLQIPIDTSLQPLSSAPPGAERGPDAYGNEPPRFVPYDADPTEQERDLFAAVSYRHRFEHPSELFAAATVRAASAALSCDPLRSLGASADPGASCSDIAHSAQSYGAMIHYWRSLGLHHTLKVGVQFGDEENDVAFVQYGRADGNTAGGPDPALTVAGRDRTTIVGASAFAQDRFQWGHLVVLGGLRYDLQAFALPTRQLLLFHTPNGRLGVNYQLSRLISLHAFVGYLWLPPSIDAPTAARALGLIPPGQPFSFDVRPEETWYAEVGTDAHAPRWLSTRASVWGRLSTLPLDDEEIGNTDLKAEYNYRRGRAVGFDLAARLVAGAWLSAFGNLSVEWAQGEQIDSAKYLFSAEQLAYQGWQAFDHEQRLTANLGFDLHDREQRTHFDVLVEYGSGLRTGATNSATLPQHTTVDVSLRHSFDSWGQPEVALDILNLLDEKWAYRIGNASVIGSAWAPLRRAFVRVVVHL